MLCKFRPFLWSGKNSVFARDQASKRLARRLKVELAHTRADETLMIIAHSHGGNIALRAFAQLGNEARKVHLVTMATPFLRVFVRDHLWGFQAPDSSFLFGPVGVLLFAGLSLVGLRPDLDSFFVQLLLLSASIILAEVFILFAISPKRYQDLRWSLRAEKIAEAVNYPAQSFAARRILVMRGVDDEASLALAAGALGTRVGSILASRVFPLGLVLGAVVLLASLFGSIVSPWIAEIYLSGVSAASAGLVTGSLCVLFLTLVPGICRSVFGKEFLFRAARCEISADSVPDTTVRVHVKTLPYGESARVFARRRHSIFENEECPEAIAVWIAKTVRPKSWLNHANEEFEKKRNAWGRFAKGR